MPHAWKHSRSGWTGLWATWSGWRCPYSLQGSWTRWPLNVASTQTILWLYDFPRSEMWWVVMTTAPDRRKNIHKGWGILTSCYTKYSQSTQVPPFLPSYWDFWSGPVWMAQVTLLSQDCHIQVIAKQDLFLQPNISYTTKHHGKNKGYPGLHSAEILPIHASTLCTFWSSAMNSTMSLSCLKLKNWKRISGG